MFTNIRTNALTPKTRVSLTFVGDNESAASIIIIIIMTHLDYLNFENYTVKNMKQLYW